MVGALISLCLMVGPGLRFLAVDSNELASDSPEVHASIQPSPTSWLAESGPTRNGTKSVAQKRIKRQSQEWTALSTPRPQELSPDFCGWDIPDQTQSHYNSHSVSIPFGRGPPLFV